MPIGSGDNNNQNNQGGGETFLSPENAAVFKKIGLGILVIGTLGILYAVIKSQLKGNQ